MPDSSLQGFDRRIAANVTFRVLGKNEVKFQFAPRIVNESNSSVWLEKDMWTYEPIRIHKGSNGRRLTMEWEYIATDNEFTGKNIAQQIRNLKSYFFDFEKERDVYPVILVKFTEIIPVETPFRLRDMNIAYGPELVDNGGLYPLYTKVSAQLELATAISTDDGDTKVDAPPLGKLKVEWF